MLDERRSRWVAKGPARVPIEWRSLPGSTLDISGIVFKQHPKEKIDGAVQDVQEALAQS